MTIKGKVFGCRKKQGRQVCREKAGASRGTRVSRNCVTPSQPPDLAQNQITYVPGAGGGSIVLNWRPVSFMAGGA